LSGSGSWRRNPESKWRLTPERLKQLTKIQADLLDDGARHASPGARLVYVTCSLLPRKTTMQLPDFLSRKSHFQVARRPKSGARTCQWNRPQEWVNISVQARGSVGRMVFLSVS